MIHIIAASKTIAEYAARQLLLDAKPKVYTKEQDLHGIRHAPGDIWIYAHARRLQHQTQTRMYDCKIACTLQNIPLLTLDLP